eukprot:5099146-Amphidinium_carterae.2
MEVGALYNDLVIRELIAEELPWYLLRSIYLAYSWRLTPLETWPCSAARLAPCCENSIHPQVKKRCRSTWR